MRKIIPYGRQEVTDLDIEEVVKTLRSDFLTQGPKALEFERAFADYCGSKYAVSCTNATSGLHMAISALSQGREGEVLTTPITFAASANAVLYNNLKVDFIDIDPSTFLMDLDLLEERLAKYPHRYQGIVPVSLAGYPIDTQRIKTLADKYGLWIVEDSCHSVGALYPDLSGQVQKSGNAKYTDVGVFSFHPVKHLACGEGGMITTNSEKLYNKLSLLKTHGITKDSENFVNPNDGGWYHEMQILGHNFRLTEIQAALGLSQLKRINHNLQLRNILAQRYDNQLSDLPLKIPYRKAGLFHAFHLYIIQTKGRKELYDFLRYRGILCQVHYIPVYRHPYYQNLGYKNGLCPRAEQYYEMALSLPMYPSLTDEEFEFIVDNIKRFYDSN